jgi:hypothetical protein
MRKVTRKCFNEGVIGLIEYNRVVRKKITSREEAERQLLREVTVVDETVKESKRKENIKEATKDDPKPDFALLGFTKEEAARANGDPGNLNPQTMTNEEWSPMFERIKR